MATKLDKTKLVRNLAAKNKLIPHIERYLDSKDGEFEWEFKYSPKDTSDDAWHPSGDCTPSLRELYLKATAPDERKIGSPLRKTFMVGHFWHQYLQEIVKRLEFCTDEQIERRGKRGWGSLDLEDCFYPYHWVTGSADIAPCSIPKHGEYLIDFKTQNSLDFRRQGLPDWSANKYEAQINIYMDFFDLENALIVCIMKDSPHDMKEIEYKRNQRLIDRIYQKWKLVAQCIDEGVEPPADEEFELPLAGPVK